MLSQKYHWCKSSSLTEEDLKFSCLYEDINDSKQKVNMKQTPP